ncbi:2-hydroxy-3-keto-5-methylthiopentenyl-1-phosphate phosphatase [Paenibacillus swuensis]|uniref:2-hydroxy-3-keto-5-methylthiopentenyl-1-phosphate phosphatase n=1 Tax=Paenibacillus swuensis TaxID=1178515 RepID=A0A172TLR5_9BACL|nr:2-hydroxy-3-keto-5-methylthiopentenyl-1-phosphate phosphatase [Paenibacillus swuensis]ANE47922.1 2-hydroxy-3-keto-5-methylthiopentenyl-1-phosphate phosphatase [Paenibacillus swuensis]
MSNLDITTHVTSVEAGSKAPVLFCDFDGTITENDNIIAIMEHFQPEGWKELVEQLTAKQISLQQCVGSMFRLFPSTMRDEVADFAIANARIREGFEELLTFCGEQQIPFLVTSGGIDFFLQPILKPFEGRIDRIYCNGSNFSGEQMEITWPYACDEHCANGACGMCKTSIIRGFDADKHYRILIGDSISDFEGAKIADLVFSRSHLTELCEELELPHIPFTTFHDVLRHLKPAVTR